METNIQPCRKQVEKAYLTEEIDTKRQSLFHYLTQRDQVTKLYNRQTFYNKVNHWNVPYSLFFMDIVSFKLINDTFGHVAGDKVICQTGEYLRKVIKDLEVQSCIGRYGGDEFIFALQSVEVEFIAKLVEKLCVSFPVYLLDESYTNVQFSIGYVRNENEESLDEVIKKADYAMYEGKRSKELYHFRDFEEVSVQYEIDSTVIRDFNVAIFEKKIFPVFQPKMNLETNIIDSFEVLCRWRKSEEECFSPGMFLPVIEKYGKIPLLDIYIFEEAMQFLEVLREKGFNHHASVNVSIKTLLMDKVVESFQTTAAKYGVRPEQVTIEILENIFERSNEQLSQTVLALSKVGFKISIDDFGLEYSSLSRLYDIYFDEIKIPREFIKEIHQPIKRKLFELILLFSKNIGVKTVVEGVETKEQLDMCRQKEVDVVQGFYYSKPLTKEGYVNYLIQTDSHPQEEEKDGVNVLEESISLKTLLNSMQKPIIVVDQKHRILYSNGHLEKVVDLPSTEIIGNRIGNVLQCSVASQSMKNCGTTELCALCPIRQAISRTTSSSLKNEQLCVQKKMTVNEDEKGVTFELNCIPYQSAVQQLAIIMVETILI